MVLQCVGVAARSGVRALPEKGGLGIHPTHLVISVSFAYGLKPVSSRGYGPVGTLLETYRVNRNLLPDM